MGAARSRLISQFLFESFLQSVIAVVLAGILVELLLNSYSSFTGKDYSLYSSQTGLLLIAMVLLTVLIGLITGSYPAFYLSSFSPMKILNTKSKTRASFVTIRVILVVFQFTVSIFLIIGTLTIFSQLKFLNNRNLRYK